MAKDSGSSQKVQLNTLGETSSSSISTLNVDEPITFLSGAKVMATGGPLNILLVFAPFAIISWAEGWSDVVTFLFSLLAIAPLAERLGFVTEQLALHTNDTLGGLLNATFGNATELIVAITALSKGLFALVQLSLLGSILSNMLLVLGTAFLFGGYYHKTQHFGKISSQVNAVLLMLAVMGLLFPTVLSASHIISPLNMLGFSRFVSMVLLLLYLAFLYFQLSTHKELYENGDEDDPAPSTSLLSTTDVTTPPRNDGDTENQIAIGEATAQAENDDEVDQLGFYYAIGWLTAITILIAFLSDALSSTIENAAEGAGVSAVFVSAIILPIVGNAAEHAGAVMFAVKGKLDLTLGVAIGSSTQIALMVLPFLVVVGWMIDKPLTLDFGAYEFWTMLVTIMTVMYAIKDGTSNWLLGVSLIAAYSIIAAGFWARQDENLSN